MSAATIRTDILARAGAAERTEDPYSDIDLRVVVSDRAYESVRAMRDYRTTTWGPFLFDSLTKADVLYFAAVADHRPFTLAWFSAKVGSEPQKTRHAPLPGKLPCPRTPNCALRP
jgi:hypothetical protein